MHPHDDMTRVPLLEEQVVVDKVAAVTDRVRVSTTVETREVVVEENLLRGQLGVERTVMDRKVAEAPPRVKKATC